MVVKFPSEAPLLLVALGTYALVMTVHWYIESKIEKEAFYVSKANSVSPYCLTRFVSSK